MRAIVFILILVVLAVIAAVATGYRRTSTRSAAASRPQVTATGNGVTAKGGQAPAFDVETGSVKVGTKETTVKVPTLEVRKPAKNAAAGDQQRDVT